MKKISKILAFPLVIATMFACSPMENPDLIQIEETDIDGGSLYLNEGTINARLSSGGIAPILWTSGPGGNASCADTGFEFDESTIRNDFNKGKFEAEWPDGFTIEVVNGKYVNWSFDGSSGQCLEAVAFIVKGGPASHIYIYDGGETSDEGLVSPLVGKKKKENADLSNLTICYSLTSCTVDSD
ncbi:MAG: hypothetical protein EP311_11505 [Cytophagales bacterium]|uniref:Lipocalin-like domain-containing protein n=1 Tax=Algoriphagus taiwanensis TaxID=1445656 RepID=A0ABQ6Q7T4_9BACT|nr:MAG: hypothetical protein EP311_11505 [Cytophagales bacterium]GMQ35588.1 hypothetical protein Ataiwa_38610 [Algoriphagus taiwanensis]